MKESSFKTIFVVWAILAAIFLIVTIFVAWHFIGKYW